MNIKMNPKTGMPDFILEKKDVQDAEKVRRTMATPGWNILMQYLMFGRETFIDAGKDGIKTRAKRDLSDVKWAVLKGFDEYMAVPNRIVKRAEEFQAAVKEAQENDGTDAGQFNGE